MSRQSINRRSDSLRRFSPPSSPATIILAISSLLSAAHSHALPRATHTVAFREFNVEPWPFLPTAAPQSPNDLRQRQFNTVCGFIGGDAKLPATCSAGSHCAADSENGVIGCCPDEGPCTQGVFIGCVDRNSDPQTDINPYVYTCTGRDVCYHNEFDGGFIQWGCGSASSVAASVATRVSDAVSLDLQSVSVSLTAEPTALSEPTTIGLLTRTRESTTSRSSSKTSTKPSSTRAANDDDDDDESKDDNSTTASESATKDTKEKDKPQSTSSSESESASDGAAAPDSDSDSDNQNVGAIVGGAVGGVAGIAALLTLGIWFWRRRNRNAREGPGPNQSSEFITSVSSQSSNFSDKPLPNGENISPMTDNRQQRFEQLPTTWEEPEPEYPTAAAVGRPPYNASTMPGQYDSNSSGSARGGAAVGGSGPYEADREPLTGRSNGTGGELDDFSRRFNTAIDHIEPANEYDGRPNAQPMGPTNNGGGSSSLAGMSPYAAAAGYTGPDTPYPGPRGQGDGPMWQQNRRRSRNLMWM